MPNFPSKNGLYTLRLNQFKLAYELTDQSIVISAVTQINMLDSSSRQLSILMNHQLPCIIRDSLRISPAHSMKNIPENRMEISITIPFSFKCRWVVSDGDWSDPDPDPDPDLDPDLDSDEVEVIVPSKDTHKRLLDALYATFDRFDMRWLGILDSTAAPAPIAGLF